MLSWVDWVSRKAVTRFGDHRLVNIQVTGNSCACDRFHKRSHHIMFYIAVIFFTNNAENQIFAHRECSFNARKVKL